MPTVKELLGWLPTSIWNLDKNENAKWKVVKDTASPEFGTSRHSHFYKKLSMFNPALAARVYLYWSKEGDIVVDPFAGRSTRGVIAVMLGRNYFGYEVVPAVVNLTKDNLKQACDNWMPDEWAHHPGSWIIYPGDGCVLKLTPAEHADLVFTCPPYHQLERYEPVKGQLSEIKDYDIFLHSMETAAHNSFRVLKPGAFCIWVVADWRDKGIFHSFHTDMIELFEAAGFHLWDIIINQLRSPAVRGVGMAANQYRTVKVHEYILVWRKPGWTKETKQSDLQERLSHEGSVIRQND